MATEGNSNADELTAIGELSVAVKAIGDIAIGGIANGIGIPPTEVANAGDDMAPLKTA